MEERVRNSANHIIGAKGYTNYGVTLAARRIMNAALRNESGLLTVSALLDGHYGLTGVCLSLPCIINREGVGRIVETPLAEQERAALYRSAKAIRDARN